ncbi:MAG: protein kinase, partial [Candidatus Hydrogenedentes bacterium]|nr:protein kinase [Candidatus Hydrogenedentota bacterium]
GFGTVYKARDKKLQRFAALKFLRFPLDSEFRRLFEREAQVIANLSKHPSIVQIYSWGEHLGSHYFALEYMDASAEGLMEKSGDPLPVKRALEITAECACALHFAHEQGVLHRDVKPANILIDGKTGHAKMCDFGLAKIHTLGGGTDASMIAGSPPYMAPEQIAGKPMDGRTDVYSLGVTLYELLSRQLPCTGSSHVDILEKIRKHKSTPLRKFRPDLSESILGIVQRATAYRPEDRYQTAEEMQEAIEAVLDSLERTGSSENVAVLRGSSRMRIGGRRVSVKMAAGALVAAGVLILAAVGVLGLLRGPDGAQSSWPVAVAAAREQIDAGQYDEAIQWLEDYMPEHASDDFAHYALGYARVLTGQIPEAREAFESISDEGLREEGLAAVNHADLGEVAREQLFEALEAVPSKYPGLLIASLDVLKSDYKDAIERLQDIDRAAFYFDWQRRQYSELLGQAYYKLEDYTMADQVLSAAAASALGATPSVNQMMYEKMAKRQLDEARGDEIRKQIQHVKALAASISAETTEDIDDWTSRPLRVRISPAKVGSSSRIAVETGLADFLPKLLADILADNEEVPIEIVDRNYIGDLLYEQELAELSKGMDRIQLGKLLGARLMIESEFGALAKEEYAWIEIVDIETSRTFGFESDTLDRRQNAREWVQDLAKRTAGEIRSEYPVRGKLTMGPDGPEINVGQSVGVRSGMKFSVLTGPGAEHRLKGDVSVTASGVDYASAVVQLDGLSQESIPADGWYVEEIQDP